MKRWPALLTIALLSFLALNATARADSFGNSVSWTIPSGSNTTSPDPNQYGGIIFRPSPLFTFAVEGLSNIVDFFGSRGNTSSESYHWDFGDGAVGSTLNVTHAYNVKGLWQTFDVIFTHCNLLTCSSGSQRVTVYFWPGVLVLGAVAVAGLFLFSLVHNLRTVQRNERRIWSKVKTARIQVQTPKVVRHPIRTVKRSVRNRRNVMQRKIVVRK